MLTNKEWLLRGVHLNNCTSHNGHAVPNFAPPVQEKGEGSHGAGPSRIKDDRLMLLVVVIYKEKG